jgi:hypothetical protein
MAGILDGNWATDYEAVHVADTSDFLDALLQRLWAIAGHQVRARG